MALLSDGQPISFLDRRANGLADTLAKHAAEQHRVPTRVRRVLHEATRGIEYAAALAGVTCMAANNHRQSVVHPDGTSSVQVCRDAAPLPRAQRQRKVVIKAAVAGIKATTPAAASSGDAVPRVSHLRAPLSHGEVASLFAPPNSCACSAMANSVPGRLPRRRCAKTAFGGPELLRDRSQRQRLPGAPMMQGARSVPPCWMRPVRPAQLHCEACVS